MGLEVVPKIQTLFIRTLAKPLGKLSRDLGDPSGAAEITTPPDRTRAAPRAMQRSPAAVRTPKGSGDRVMARGGPVGGRGGSSPESFISKKPMAFPHTKYAGFSTFNICYNFVWENS